MNKYKKRRVNGCLIEEQRLVMQEYLGRPLEPEEVVHHLNEDKRDNRIENLELCLKSVHAIYHAKKGDYFDIGKWTKENLATGYIHGTYSSWRHTGCRCEPCVLAQREYKRSYRRRTGIH